MHLDFLALRPALYALVTSVALTACGGESATDDGAPGGVGEAAFALDRSSYSVNETDGELRVHIQRQGSSAGVANVTYGTQQYGTDVSNRASAGAGDYLSASGTVTFQSGETRKMVAITVNDDDEAQGNLVFGIHLTGTDRGRIGDPSQSQVTIIDDESDDSASGGGDFRLSASSYSVGEGDGRLTVTVQRVNGASGAASVRYSTRQYTPAGGSNAHDADSGEGDDYDGSTAVLEFDDGQTEATFDVPITDDAEYTGNLNFGVYLQEPSTGLAQPSEASVTIVDDEQPEEPATGEFRLSSSAFSVGESGGSVDITVQRVNGDSGTASVGFSTYDLGGGQAVAGEDYTAASGALTFGEGETQASFSVNVLDDDVYSGDRDFGVRIADATTALGTPREATVTIGEDDPESPEGAFRLGASSYLVSENGGSIQLTVERVNGASGETTVDYATVSTGSGEGFAVAGEDYESRSATLSFADGQTQQTFSVPVLDDDDYTGSLGFAVRLSNAGTSLADPSEASVTITDDESEAPTGDLRLSASGYSVDESAGSITVHVERVNGTDGEVSVDFAAEALNSGDGDAVSGSDFNATSGTLDFADGVTERSFQVDILDDDSYTGELSFRVRLSGASTSVASPAEATVTIIDDEPEPTQAPTLVWDAPTTNADGSCLDDLDGFRINYGLNSGDYQDSHSASLEDLEATQTGETTDCAEVVSYALPLEMLDTASWYVTVQSRDTDGNLSEHSEEIVVTVE